MLPEKIAPTWLGCSALVRVTDWPVVVIGAAALDLVALADAVALVDADADADTVVLVADWLVAVLLLALAPLLALAFALAVALVLALAVAATRLAVSMDRSRLTLAPAVPVVATTSPPPTTIPAVIPSRIRRRDLRPERFRAKRLPGSAFVMGCSLPRWRNRHLRGGIAPDNTIRYCRAVLRRLCEKSENSLMVAEVLDNYLY
jgi:hypothetical protein